jgi:ABC-type amino acid transport substrate-binding protein
MRCLLKVYKEVALKKILVVAALLTLVVSICVVGQQTLETVLARGRLIVGVNAVLPGFGALDAATGEYTGSTLLGRLLAIPKTWG